MKKFAAIVTLVTAFSLSGCAATNQDVGAVSGGVIGGLVGSQFGGGTGQLVAIGAGTLAGALIGSSIGKNMDDTDRMRATQALDSNRVGEPAYWTNEKTHAQYKVTPTRNVQVNGNKYCREYTTTAVVAGKTQQVYGKACRKPDGTWKVVN